MGSGKERGQEALTWTPSPAALAKKFVGRRSLQSLSSDCPPAQVRWAGSAEGSARNQTWPGGAPSPCCPAQHPFCQVSPRWVPTPPSSDGTAGYRAGLPPGLQTSPGKLSETQAGAVPGSGNGGQSTAGPVCRPLPKATVTESPPREKQHKGTTGRGSGGKGGASPAYPKLCLLPGA